VIYAITYPVFQRKSISYVPPPPDESVATPAAPKKNENRRTATAVSGRTLNNLRYADDIVLIGNTPTEGKGKGAYT